MGFVIPWKMSIFKKFQTYFLVKNKKYQTYYLQICRLLIYLRNMLSFNLKYIVYQENVIK